MDSIRLKAFGKINISLDVTGRREDGYHFVRMIMQTVSLCDMVTVTKNDGNKIALSCDNPEVPLGRDNIAFRAAEKMLTKYNIKSGLDIEIEKHIPMAAGMAGGSTDAAAVIKGINEIFGLGLTVAQMDETAVTLGADVPFCLRQGTYLAEGIGERLTRLKSIPEFSIVVVNPGIEVSTREIYTELDSCRDATHPETDLLLSFIEGEKWEELFANMGNILEPVTEKRCTDIKLIKSEMMKCGAGGRLMTGTGPTVFGVFADRDQAVRAEQHFRDNYDNYRSILCTLTE